MQLSKVIRRLSIASGMAEDQLELFFSLAGTQDQPHGSDAQRSQVNICNAVTKQGRAQILYCVNCQLVVKVICHTFYTVNRLKESQLIRYSGTTHLDQ